MSLLEELRLERDYWLTPVTSGPGHRLDATWPATGQIDNIVMVKKGANTPEMELNLLLMEALMASALGDETLANDMRAKAASYPPEAAFTVMSMFETWSPVRA